MFDARVFTIPKEEVTNLIYWRQLDATRNSIQMVGQANFSHKELQNKSCNEIQDMLMLQKNINWNNFPVSCKRGSCCIKKELSEVVDTLGKLSGEIQAVRTGWVIDDNIPIFKEADRAYIDKLVYIGDV
jgi:tRNA(His) 5'-end guanylyltransferase